MDLDAAIPVTAIVRKGSFLSVASMGLLELLRLGLVGTVAVLLNQPEWIEEIRPEEKPAMKPTLSSAGA